MASFSHSLNGQGLVITPSPDGSRVYVGGDFTTVDGVARSHIAAFNTATGALDNAFTPSRQRARSRRSTASNTTVYVGRQLLQRQQRRARPARRLHAPATAPCCPGRPRQTTTRSTSMVLAPDGSRVIVGGKFTTLNGVPAPRHGLPSTPSPGRPCRGRPTSGSTTVATVRRSTACAPTAPRSTAPAMPSAPATSRAPSSPTRTPATSLVANDCHGDTYDVCPLGSVLYTRQPRARLPVDRRLPADRRGLVHQHAARPRVHHVTHRHEHRARQLRLELLRHRRRPRCCSGSPSVAIGSYTGQSQAAWSVTGNTNYVVLGGEFPRVNGAAQQGLVRFAMKPLAPNKRRPGQVHRRPGSDCPVVRELAPPGSHGSRPTTWTTRR